MAKPETNTQATQEPATRPGPPAGPKIRFIRPSPPHEIGLVTNRYPYDSCVRLINERTVEVVDPKEFEEYRVTYERKQAEANKALEERLRVERERREAQDKHASGVDRMMRPAEVVTK